MEANVQTVCAEVSKAFELTIHLFRIKSLSAAAGCFPVLRKAAQFLGDKENDTRHDKYHNFRLQEEAAAKPAGDKVGAIMEGDCYQKLMLFARTTTRGWRNRENWSMSFRLRSLFFINSDRLTDGTGIEESPITFL